MRTIPPVKPLVAFNLSRWIETHRAELRPPVGNKRIFHDSEFIIMVVGGPNSRKDFHVDPAEEFFFQLEGDMLLHTQQHGKRQTTRIAAGDILLLPPGVPHSPERFADTVGLVVERERREAEQDGFQWYCENCNALLYQEAFGLTNIETQFPALFERFYGDRAKRSCKQCGSVMARPR